MDPADNSFDALRRALALKRHEQPPPAYFDRLHERVLDRLTLDQEAEPEDWFGAILERFRLRPALAGVFSFALGAFYLAGLGYSGRVTRAPHSAQPSFQLIGGYDRRSPTVFEPWMSAALKRELRASSPSVTPVLPTGLPAPGLRPWTPDSSGAVAPVGYVVPPR